MQNGPPPRKLRIGQVHSLFVIPVAYLAAFAIGGMTTLAIAALFTTAALAVALPFATPAHAGQSPAPSARSRVEREVGARLSRTLWPVGVFTLEIDIFKSLSERYGFNELQDILTECERRLRDAAPANGFVVRLDPPCFAVISGPDDMLDLETGLQIAARLQSALAAPIPRASGTVQLTASIGFSLSNRIPSPTATSMLDAALTAMIEAQRNGPSGVRSFSARMRNRIDARKRLSEEIPNALAEGQISSFFQPQISAVTGEITGFETLARWNHPQRGLIPPNEFLPAFHDAHALGTLGQLMIQQALAALRSWDDAGLRVPCIGVNLSTVELSNPALVDHITWALDAQNIPAHRLNIEVLETVVANTVSGTVTDNLHALANLGCGIDLDDFGTGHAAITSIRKFSIERIKIDRSFVSNIDADPEQQNMVAAILTMAERLGLAALAEGVETREEVDRLRTLGCTHLQGFHIGHPMPLEDAQKWIAAYQLPHDTGSTITRISG